MFDLPSFRIGRVFGIPVEVNLSWLLIFALVAFSLGTSYFPGIAAAEGAPEWLTLLVGALTALAFFGSILAHELSHSLVAKAQGGGVEKITLFIFGGVAQIDDEPESAGREFLMASAGPAMSLLLSALAFIGFNIAFGRAWAWWIWAPLQYLSAINLAVAVFNLLPGFPLDGGRVFRSLIWGITHDLLRATRWAALVGQFIGWLMVTGAVLGILNGRLDLIWFGLIGWFIASLAGQAYQQQVVRSAIEGVSVKDIMTPEPEYVSGDLTLDQLVHDHFLGSRHSRYPVMYEGSIVGLVTLPAIKEVDRTDWPFVRTIDVTDRRLDELVTAEDDPVRLLLPRLSGERPGALLVVRDGRLTGIVTRADVIHTMSR